MASSPRSRVDPDVPEELQGLPGQNVGSEAEIQGLEPPPNRMPNMAPREAFNVSFFFWFVCGGKEAHCKEGAYLQRIAI